MLINNAFPCLTYSDEQTKGAFHWDDPDMDQ